MDSQWTPRLLFIAANDFVVAQLVYTSINERPRPATAWKLAVMSWRWEVLEQVGNFRQGTNQMFGCSAYGQSPIPVAERSKAWVCGHSPVGIAVLNPAEDMKVCLL